MELSVPDPSLEEGKYTETFQVEIPVIIENSEVKINDTVMLRLFKMSSKEQYKIQLSSEANMSFLYKCIVEARHYEEYRARESFGERRSFTEWFQGFFELEKEPFAYHVQLQSERDSQLIVYEEEKYKQYEVIRFKFQIMSQKELKASIMYRYEKMKLRKQYLSWYWGQISQIVKVKNPSLLCQLNGKSKSSYQPSFK